MKTSLNRSASLLLVTLPLVLCCFLPVGCSHNPTAADYQRIANDKSLTAEQRQKELLALQPNPDAQANETAIGIAVVGVVILIVAFVGKESLNKIELNATPAGTSKTANPHYGSTAKKPSSATPNSKAAPAGPPAAYLEQIKKEEKPEKKIPSTQAEVDQIPLNQRSMSFFTSQPLPVEDVVQVPVRIGYSTCTVTASEHEAELCRTGKVPRIRAFTIQGKTIPWYEWDRYNPYKHYWALDASGWATKKGVIPCFVHVENVDPALKGYYEKQRLVAGS